MIDILKIIALLGGIQVQLVQALQKPGAKAMDNLREAYRHISIAISYLETANEEEREDTDHEATRI